MQLYALSDLHIASSREAIYLSTLSFLRKIPREGDVIVLGGDIFDLFVGSKSLFLDRYHEFFEVLGSLLRFGVEVHYIEGNHDFHLSRALASVAAPSNAVKLHSARVKLKVSGKSFLFEHGDLVDRGDVGYLLLRSLFRSPPFRGLVACVPGSWVEAIGKKSSEASARNTRSPTLDQQEKIQRIYRNYAVAQIEAGVDYVVLGHCHLADQMRFQCGQRRGEYWNMGYPKESFEVLAWSEADGMYRTPLK